MIEEVGRFLPRSCVVARDNFCVSLVISCSIGRLKLMQRIKLEVQLINYSE